MSNDVIARLRDLTTSLDVWLAGLPSDQRLDALADLHDAVQVLKRLVVVARSATLSELVDAQGLELVADALGVTPDRLLELIARRPPRP